MELMHADCATIVIEAPVVKKLVVDVIYSIKSVDVKVCILMLAQSMKC